MTNNNRVQVLVNDDIYKALKELAWQDKRTLSDFLRNLLTEYVEEYQGK